MRKNGIIRFENRKKRIITGIFLGILSFCFCFFGYDTWKAGGVFLFLFFVSSLFMVEISNKRLLWLYYVVWFIVIAWMTLYLSQFVQNEGVFQLSPIKNILGFIICILPMLLVFMILQKARISTLLVSSVILILSSINCYVYSFRGNEIIISDLLSAKTAMNVARGYSLLPPKIVVLCWILFVLLVFISTGFPKWRPEKILHTRIVSALLCCAIVGVLLTQGKSIPVIHFGKGSCENGFLLNFVLQSREMIINKPDDYDIKHIDEIASQYNNKSSKASVNEPDIIVIMEESFADLEVLGNKIKTNIEVTPFIDSLKKNTIKGMCLSSVYGGWTPNSEYEFLTGNSLLFLNGIIYQQYLKAPSYSMVSDLKSRGYTCIAMHPYYKNGWKRDSVWPNLMFDECLFLDSFPQKNLIRGLVSDREMFDVLIQNYEEQKQAGNGKLFFFGVTMQNHGGYDNEEYDSIVKIEGLSKNYSDAEQYLSLIHETDKAIESLIKYFQSVEDNVVIVFFGDHQPSLNEDFINEISEEDGSVDLEDIEKKYKVPFFIWTNYDSQEEEVELTSLNYLSTYVYKKAGLSLPSYNRFLEDVEAVFPAMNAYGFFSARDNTFYSLQEAEGEEKEVLDQYWNVEYNSLFDKKHRNNIFFPLFNAYTE